MVVAVTNQKGPRKATELQESHSGGETEVRKHRLALQLEKLAGPATKGMWAGHVGGAPSQHGHLTKAGLWASLKFPVSLPGRKGLRGPAEQPNTGVQTES